MWDFRFRVFRAFNFACKVSRVCKKVSKLSAASLKYPLSKQVWGFGSSAWLFAEISKVRSGFITGCKISDVGCKI